jgi:uncharacterized protein YjiS (DUF1127 family)
VAEVTAQSNTKHHSTGLLRTITHVIGDLFLRYRQRQTLHELAAMDDHLLEDIGIRRTEISSVSLSENGRMERDLHIPRHQLG